MKKIGKIKKKKKNYNFLAFGTTSDDEKMEGLEIYINFLWLVWKKNERMEKAIGLNLL